MCATINFECGVLRLGGFLCLRAKLDNLSVSSSPRFPFQWRPEVRRNIKINHLRHHYLLWCESLVDGAAIAFYLK
jgi:hypothetical protein